MKAKKEGFRAFLDLTNYDSKASLDVMLNLLTNRAEFLERIEDVFYFSFRNERERIRFLYILNQGIKSIGFDTKIDQRDDPFAKKKKTIRDMITHRDREYKSVKISRDSHKPRLQR